MFWDPTWRKRRHHYTQLKRNNKINKIRTGWQLEPLNKHLNKITPNLKFTLETETNGILNFLELILKKQGNKLDFRIYRIPTATNHNIHAISYHPMTHKIAAYHSSVHRLLTISLKPENYNKELEIIRYTPVANGYISAIIDKIINKQLTFF